MPAHLLAGSTLTYSHFFIFNTIISLLNHFAKDFLHFRHILPFTTVFGRKSRDSGHPGRFEVMRGASSVLRIEFAAAQNRRGEKK